MTETTPTRRTPLYEEHKALKAKTIPFGGWDMPVSYTSVLAEHKAVREACGLFDVSHMGEVVVKGKDATRFLQHVTINDPAKLQPGQGQYSAILNPDGGMIDDLIVYRLTDDEYFICVNASNADKDFAWIKQQSAKFPGVSVDNESPRYSQLAVQGPTSLDAVRALVSQADQAKLEALPYTNIMRTQIGGKPALLARTGYTGEKGYELYIPNEAAVSAWKTLLATQPKTGIQPIGLGARDTLRLEACYLLYGNDMDDGVSPLEAGIGWAVAIDKPDFIGKAKLVSQKEKGLTRSIFCFLMDGDGIPRHDMQVYKGADLIGKVTSGSVLPTLGGAGGMALLDPRKVAVGDVVEVDVRGKRKLAKLVKRPLYKAKVKA